LTLVRHVIWQTRRSRLTQGWPIWSIHRIPVLMRNGWRTAGSGRSFDRLARSPDNKPLHLTASALRFFRVQRLTSRRGRRTVSFGGGGLRAALSPVPCDVLLGTLTHTDDDFPWHNGTFDPAPAFEEVRAGGCGSRQRTTAIEVARREWLCTAAAKRGCKPESHFACPQPPVRRTLAYASGYEVGLAYASGYQVALAGASGYKRREVVSGARARPRSCRSRSPGCR
jgi:hypothetical protein